MNQIANNTSEQALLGGFAQAIDDAVLNSSAVHQYYGHIDAPAFE
ncbi:MAG: hypothetical protein PHF31_15625 [Methylobacter sp.]|nr:hypothetical protein [Methylobacter sp.]